jgi:AmmeMemoRadiSam system protein B
MRDPLGYSESVVVVPPAAALMLPFFDGQHSILDCQTHLTRLSGDIVPADQIRQFIDALNQQGFLLTPEFEALRNSRETQFRQSNSRQPAHAGTGYPAEAGVLRQTLSGYIDGTTDSVGNESKPLIGIAAPHVSPHGGFTTYAAAYRAMPKSAAEKTVVILGTSHYGRPNRFGLTNKPFVTPLGMLPVDVEAAEFLKRRVGDAIVEEDYCHAVEHSIEFQCVFTQFVTGANPKILPILCGPLLHRHSSNGTRVLDDDDAVKRFLDALGELAAQRSNTLFWVLGIDLAHIGRRYGDDLSAKADSGPLQAVAEKDRERLVRVAAGDASGFRELVYSDESEEGYLTDTLKWCGYSPLYAFMRALPQSRADTLHYQQWNIDNDSVVSFAALAFRDE